MKTYTVSIEVAKVYDIEVEADSAEAAAAIAEDMQSTAIADRGGLQNVETRVVEVSEEVSL